MYIIVGCFIVSCQSLENFQLDIYINDFGCLWVFSGRLYVYSIFLLILNSFETKPFFKPGGLISIKKDAFLLIYSSLERACWSVSKSCWWSVWSVYDTSKNVKWLISEWQTLLPLSFNIWYFKLVYFDNNYALLLIYSSLEWDQNFCLILGKF